MEYLEKLIKIKAKKQENIVENLLPIGITNFSGDPKIGKTFFLIQLCCSIVEKDSNFLGLKTSNFTKVLYYSTETPQIEFMKRINLLKLDFKKIKHYIKIDFKNEVCIRDIRNDLSDLNHKKNENVLVVIDTSENLKFDRYYDVLKSKEAYDITSIFKDLRDEYNASFILVKHNVKNNQSLNPFNAISGSIGVTASAETNIILQKHKDENYKLIMQSRYLKDLTLNLKKDDLGFFELNTEEIIDEIDDLDIISLIKYVTVQKEKSIEETPTKICAKSNLKYTTGVTLYKKLKKYMKEIEENGFYFTQRRSNGKNLIKIELIEKDNNKDNKQELINIKE